MITFRITDRLLHEVHHDLDRHHEFARERVGFLVCGVAGTVKDLTLLAAHYRPVADDDYVPDDSAAAMLGPGAFRKMLQEVYNRPSAVIHVHRHDHHGHPGPSRIDVAESRKFMPDFWKVCPRHPHGALILSLDSMRGEVWLPDRQNIVPFERYFVVGNNYRSIPGARNERENV